MTDANDAHLLALLGLVREHPKPAKAALTRMTERAAAKIAKLEDEKREAARLLPLRFELARECVLDPTLLEDGTEVFVDKQPGFDPHLVDPGRAIPRWMTRMRELGLDVEWGAARDLGSAIDMIKRARDKGIDITKRTGAECYVHFQLGFDSKVWSERDIRAAVDPALVEPVVLPMSFLLFETLKPEYFADADAGRTAEQWWEIAVLMLLFQFPDFDGSEVGLAPPIAWENVAGHPDDGWARCSFKVGIREHQQAHDRLLARTALYLGALAKAPKPGGPATAPRSKRTAGAKAPRGFIFVQDAQAQHGIADSTINDWAAITANNLRPGKHATGLKYVHGATLNELIRKHRESKG